MTDLLARHESLARESLEPSVVDYIAGGAGAGTTLRENLRAFRRRSLLPAAGGALRGASTATSVLGMELSMPLLIAPLAYQPAVHAEAELGMMRAVTELGSALCVSAFGSTSPAELRKACPGGRWLLQLYVLRDKGLQREVVERALAARPKAVMVTVDPPAPGADRDVIAALRLPPGTELPLLGTRTPAPTTPRELLAMVEPEPAWEDVAALAAELSLPVVVKGLLDPADARTAREHGAAAVVVSNHGGRHRDGALASLDALGPVADAVGEGVEILLDGGVRSGEDVAKALALGADGMLLGRPAMWALAAGGGAAVAELLRWLRADLEATLVESGCAAVDALRPALVRENGGRA
ncbi:MAG: alpha-hydroxy acid oxidase [Solirubrobacterales bacterium]